MIPPVTNVTRVCDIKNASDPFFSLFISLLVRARVTLVTFPGAPCSADPPPAAACGFLNRKVRASHAHA